MLVLTRKPGESIIIGATSLTVVSLEGRKVRLGFTAPPGVRIDREEVRARAREPRADAPLIVEAEALA